MKKKLIAITAIICIICCFCACRKDGKNDNINVDAEILIGELIRLEKDAAILQGKASAIFAEVPAAKALIIDGYREKQKLYICICRILEFAEVEIPEYLPKELPDFVESVQYIFNQRLMKISPSPF